MSYQIIIKIDDIMWKKMRKYPEIDWNEVMVKAIWDKLDSLKVEKQKTRSDMRVL
ncbi:MAG: hypothetical protein NTW67_00570 [Candidatus Woesearchaeota archaeon]|nr:hypothetical protein [Candidatus Woesearchaeota archaeon]